LEHFNNGWAQGFDYAVRGVEFVNEPDGLGGFGGERLGELIPAFLAFMRAIAQYNRAHPTTPVRAVGPGIPFCLAGWSHWQPRFSKLLVSLRAAGLDLPVFSFHTYGRDVSPRANEGVARALRQLLDQHGFQKTELWNTEWQGGGFLRQHLGLDQLGPANLGERELRLWGYGLVSYALACKIRWQGLLQGSYYYRANMRAFGPTGPPLQLLGERRPGYALLFSPSGQVRPLALGELLTHRIASEVPHRCRTQWADDGLLAALGLRSERGERVGVLLSSLATQPRQVALRLAGLPPARNLTVRVAWLDADRQGGQSPPMPMGAPTGSAVPWSIAMPPLSAALAIIEPG